MDRFLPGKATLALVHLWYSEQKKQGDGPDGPPLCFLVRRYMAARRLPPLCGAVAVSPPEHQQQERQTGAGCQHDHPQRQGCFVPGGGGGQLLGDGVRLPEFTAGLCIGKVLAAGGAVPVLDVAGGLRGGGLGLHMAQIGVTMYVSVAYPLPAAAFPCENI